MKEYQCPLCKVELTLQYGTQVHPNDPNYGVTLYCANRKCPAQEVSGHGKNEKDAFLTIEQKYMGKR